MVKTPRLRREVLGVHHRLAVVVGDVLPETARTVQDIFHAAEPRVDLVRERPIGVVLTASRESGEVAQGKANGHDDIFSLRRRFRWYCAFPHRFEQ